MKIDFREAKNVVVKSSIPGVDFVINPYTGCQHGCIYCYAEFMKRFTDHKGEDWGNFLDIKEFDVKKIKPKKYNNKSILISSVTDPYIPLEIKYKNTQKVLKSLLGTEAAIKILTKSKFAERDIDLFKQFKNIEVGISINTLDDQIAKKIEPLASKPIERIDLIAKLKKNNIKTFIFISPFFPVITDFRKIIGVSMDYTDYYMFENLNFRPHNISRISNFLEKNNPNLIPLYQKFRENYSKWEEIKNEIRLFCNENNLECKIEFHHGGFS
ncbi:MAG: radical SAM protein [Promethearchaeota archaeon]|nr:MAG: radical SAM protein [Candidatus Lokiarchaeota archaeon]